MLENPNRTDLLEHENQHTDWHKWREAERDPEKPYAMADFLNEQYVEAIQWYEEVYGKRFPFFSPSKRIKDYSQEERLAMDDAFTAWGDRVNPDTLLKGSEDFARRNMMRRTDLPLETLEEKYKVWEDKERSGESR